MCEDGESLLFPTRWKPDDKQDWTERIIWEMRSGYRRHYKNFEKRPASTIPCRKNRKRKKS